MNQDTNNKPMSKDMKKIRFLFSVSVVGLTQGLGLWVVLSHGDNSILLDMLKLFVWAFAWTFFLERFKGWDFTN